MMLNYITQIDTVSNRNNYTIKIMVSIMCSKLVGDAQRL